MAVPVQAQVLPRPAGNVSVMGDWFPNRSTGPNPVGPTFRSGDTLRSSDPDGGLTEVRGRLFVEQKVIPSANWSFTFSAFAEGLAGRSETAIARVHEATTDIRLGRFDLYAGYGRVAWGRLDELQPTDVINPLDISRFFFEGRSEARLPVPVVRGRWYFSDTVSLEGVYVPVFRRGRFDQLAEPSSPFNILPPFTTADVTCQALGCPPLQLPVTSLEPSRNLRSGQGGARFSATTKRVDWSVSAYRGFEPFALYRLNPGLVVPPFTGVPRVDGRFPRFTMVGGDLETVRGQWGIRGEVAAFVRDNFQSADGQIAEGSSVDAGVGVDRRAGSYRLSGTVLFHHERLVSVWGGIGGTGGAGGTGGIEVPPVPPYKARKDASLIVSADRTFAQERYQVRAFTVYNPSEGSSFLRGIFTAKVTDDVAVEASGGWFGGDGRDTVGRFGDSDFVYARVRYYF